MSLEMSHRNQQEKIVFLTNTPILDEMPGNLDIEWIEGDSNSEKSFHRPDQLKLK
ncbi:MAG: hypothetical protein Ct9H300mP28_17390 [Pseudomonadota bacterium]|nr:MAG: hypothetical protein Ct9H300mP28_17390 [Pseudomonadota bacterium]